MSFFKMIAVIAVVAFTLSACVIFPTQLPDPNPFRKELLDFLVIGQTTKDEVDEVMNNFTVNVDGENFPVKLTPRKFKSGQWWLYEQSREELQWVFAAEGGGIVFGSLDYRFLLIKFDERDRVAGFETSSLEGDGCNRRGVCRLGTPWVGLPHHVLLAPDDEDQAAKARLPAANQCLVYLYPKSTSRRGGFEVEREVQVEISFDDEPSVEIVSGGGYLLWPVQFGRHRISLVDPISGDTVLTREFDCQRSEALFFEYIGFDWWGRLVRRIEQVDEEKGRRGIRSRRLMSKLSPIYMLLAPDDEDQSAKALLPAADQCLVYLYPRRILRAGLFIVPLAMVEISFNDERAVALAAFEGYLFWAAQLGRHQISLIDAISRDTVLVHEFDCQRNEALFFEYIGDWKREDLKRRIEQVDEINGRREINLRRLILMD